MSLDIINIIWPPKDLTKKLGYKFPLKYYSEPVYYKFYQGC
jgi:hypothetical protein